MTAVTGFMILFFFEVYLFLFMNFTVHEDVVPAFMIIRYVLSKASLASFYTGFTLQSQILMSLTQVSTDICENVSGLSFVECKA